jgi:hypothetical protein
LLNRYQSIIPFSDEEDVLFSGLHLLGEKREHRAYRPICRFLLDGPASERTLYDAITVTLPGILINVCDGDPTPL